MHKELAKIERNANQVAEHSAMPRSAANELLKDVKVNFLCSESVLHHKDCIANAAVL